MKLESIQAAEKKLLLNTYERNPVLFTGGKGVHLRDAEGREYLDLLSGIGVSALGYGHPAVEAAIVAQTKRLLHTSNLFFHEHTAELALRLTEISGLDRVFLCNSGTEAWEAALKLAPVSYTHLDVYKRQLHEESEAWRAWPSGATNESAFFAEERRGSTFDDAVSVVRAAGAGHGLALARWSLVALDIECGRLAIASRTILPIKSAYFFVCPESYLDIEKIAAFRAWIMEEARRAPRPPLKS